MKRYSEFLNSNKNDRNLKLYENFLNRSTDKTKNLAQSFKNLIISLKNILEFPYRIEFFKELIKSDIKAYRKTFISNHDKDIINDFKREFDELFDDIDEELILELKLRDLYNKITEEFDEGDSVDINQKKISKIFEIYLEDLDDFIDNTYSLFKRKIEKDKNYEPLSKMDVIRSKISQEEFDKQKYFLQIELLKMQEWCFRTGKRILVIFEGRDAAGKGSAIRSFTQNLDNKHYRIENFGIPTEEESKNWFDRYKKVIPKTGEVVFFDRSWYVRGYIEPAMQYIDEKDYKQFMNEVNDFEKYLVEDEGVILIKLWFSISKDIQRLRFELRKANPLKYWKYSRNDEKVYKLWDNFTDYINKLLKKTNTNESPWIIIDADDNRLSKIEAIKSLLSKVDYEDKIDELVDLKKVKKHNIIFLDIDGVMIPKDVSAGESSADNFSKDKKWGKNAVKNINKLISRVAGKIVFASAYRQEFSNKQINKQFKNVGIKEELFDTIPTLKDVDKGIEIKEWLKQNRHKVKNFVILDDKPHDYDVVNSLNDHFIRIDPTVGLTDGDIQKAMNIIFEDDKTKELIRNSIK